MEMLLAIGILNIVYLAMRSQKPWVIKALGGGRHPRTEVPLSHITSETTIKRFSLILNLVLNGLVWNIIWHLPETTALFTGIVWALWLPAEHLRSYISMRKIVKQHEQSLKAYEALLKEDEELFNQRP